MKFFFRPLSTVFFWLQEIIGYGGECYYSSSGDEEDDSPPQKSAGSSRGSSESAASDELTAEERSIISLTKKNTTFNSHAQNLRDNPAGLETALKLGQQEWFYTFL